MPPSVWLVLSDKQGDNGQLETIATALNWPCERKYLHMRAEYVLGKPRHKPSLDHIDLERSDPLEGPWPDLILTAGRRPSMVALWIRQQSNNHSKIVLVGKPTSRMLEFSLVVASAINQLPPMPNYLPISLPLMRMDPGQVAAAAGEWRQRLAPLPQPLVAILVGGQTSPFRMNAKVARNLVAAARQVVEEGGTPYITTSRRTTPEVVEILREELPPQAKFFAWSADASDNPYRALLGSADGFIVTGDSISMMVEVIYLRKPLAIFPLPLSPIGRIDQLRRSFAHWLFNPRRESTGDRLRHALARGVFYIDYFKLLCATRDFRAFHRHLVEQKLAVWAGEAFRPVASPLPDDTGRVVARIEALFAGRQ